MSIVDLIFPKECLGCGGEGSYLCKDCVAKATVVKQICLICERPSVNGMTHAKCRRPLSLDGAFSIWDYQGIIRQAILKLKYRFAQEIAFELIVHMSNYFEKNKPIFPKESILVPVPLHKFRRKWRGFNQVEEIAKSLAQRFNWGFAPDILIRRKLVRPQVELKGKQRWQNIKGVFAFNPDCILDPKQYSFILFDDVWTSGATLKEAAKVLKRGGAKKVWGLTIAR